jgi:propionaldehyde dehydrogenase
MNNDPRINEIVRQVLEKVQKEVADTGQKCTGSSFGFAEVDQAVETSAKAQKIWHQDFPLEKKKEILNQLRADLLEQVEEIAADALEDTGMGNLPDKIIKNRLAIEKTPGPEYFTTKATSGDNGLVLEEYAPFGVIASITPSTNPTASVINNAILMLSSGNSVVFAPHPGASRCTLNIIRMVHDSLTRQGAPAGLVSTLTVISMENVDKLMKHPQVRLVAATGGPGVVHTALSSGKPAIGAGPGNPPVVVDETAHIEQAAKDIILGSSFDNNLPCTSEKEIIAVNCISDELKKYMLENGAFELKNPKEIEALKNLVLNGERTAPDKKYVGKDATFLLSEIGIKAPSTVKLIVVECEEDDPFVQVEMLMPIIGLVRVPDFNAALEAALRCEHGFRHSAIVHSTNIDNMSVMARAMETTMFTKNAPSFASLGFGGDCPTAFTIATTTGEGPTTPISFCRIRRCTLHGSFRIV